MEANFHHNLEKTLLLIYDVWTETMATTEVNARLGFIKIKKLLMKKAWISYYRRTPTEVFLLMWSVSCT